MRERARRPSDTTARAERGHEAARAAQARAEDARRRASAAAGAAEEATTEYARRAYLRVAELHTQIARSHERAARTLRMGVGHADRA